MSQSHDPHALFVQWSKMRHFFDIIISPRIEFTTDISLVTKRILTWKGQYLHHIKITCIMTAEKSSIQISYFARRVRFSNAGHRVLQMITLKINFPKEYLKLGPGQRFMFGFHPHICYYILRLQLRCSVLRRSGELRCLMNITLMKLLMM